MNDKVVETEVKDDFKTATKIDEIDRLRLEVLTERERRLNAETENCQLALQKLREEMVQHQGYRAGFTKEFFTKYGIGPTDVLNQRTGEITRHGAVRIVKHEKSNDVPAAAPVNSTPAADAKPEAQATPAATA